MSKVKPHADLGKLVSEQVNPDTQGIDALSSLEIVGRINDEDKKVPGCVERVLPAVARAVDMVVEAFRKGGRLLYVGAGTSGRLGIADAAECRPTFGVPVGMVWGVIAGGDGAIRVPVEGIEDHEEIGAADIAKLAVGERDIVVGIASSGRTPYVIGALAEARRRKAATVAIANNPDSAIGQVADLAIEIITGPEVIMGSTRMKAGTSQKMVLNMISTGAMIRIGKVYSNLMVDLSPSNSKLVDRSKRLIARAAKVDLDTAGRYFSASGGSPKVAIVMIVAHVEREQALQFLAEAGGGVARAIQLAAHAGDGT